MLDNLSSLSEFDAQRIIDSLRVGTVPTDQLKTLTVGRDDILTALRDDLDFIAAGGSKVRLISASYGGGKTHLLGLLSHAALNSNFLVSHVQLHAREAPFDQFEVIFSVLMQGLRSASSSAGIEDVLNLWIKKNRFYEAADLEAALSLVTSSPDMKAALRAYVTYSEAQTEHHIELKTAVVSWLSGTKLPAAIRTRIGVRNPVSITTVSEVLRSFLLVAREAGYSGVVFLLDEAEAVTTLERTQRRNDANQNLRKLLDNADNNQGLFVVFATTPRFLNDEKKGAMSYAALWDRIRPVLRGSKFTQVRGPVIPLPPLSNAEFKELASRILQVYSKAYGWNGPADGAQSVIPTYVDVFSSSKTEGSVRGFLRAWIAVLDNIEPTTALDEIKELFGELEFGADDDNE